MTKRNFIIICAGLIIFLVIAKIQGNKKRELINLYGRYTSGTFDKYKMYRTGKTVFFTFKYKNHIFQGKDYSDLFYKDLDTLTGKNFLVKFDSLNPSLCYFYLDHPVPDSVIIPDNGVEELNF